MRVCYKGTVKNGEGGPLFRSINCQPSTSDPKPQTLDPRPIMSKLYRFFTVLRGAPLAQLQRNGLHRFET